MRSSSGGHAYRSLACTSRMPGLGDAHLGGVEPLLVARRTRVASSRTRSSDASFTDMCSPGLDPRRVGRRTRGSGSDRPVARCSATFAKQRSCDVLRVELEERVEHDEDERELAVDRHIGHVADRHRESSRRPAWRASARPSPATRRRRAPRHRCAASGSRDPPGADAELERPPAGRELGEQCDFGARCRPACTTRRRRRRHARRRFRARSAPSANRRDHPCSSTLH